MNSGFHGDGPEQTCKIDTLFRNSGKFAWNIFLQFVKKNVSATAASFVVLSGSLKAENHEEGRSSIVEDGVMIQVFLQLF